MGRILRCGFFLVLTCSGILPSRAAEPANASRERIAGDYRLQGIMETASGLRLNPDGRYQFFLIYGIADEKDEGRWHVEGSTVVLNSTAPSTSPGFVFVRSSLEAAPGVKVSFEGETARVAVALTRGVLLSNDREIAFNELSGDYMQARSAAPPVQKIRLVLLGALREYPVHDHEPADPAHNHFVFRLNPGNYGHVRFDAVALRIGDDELLLKTPQMRREFRYVRLKK